MCGFEFRKCSYYVSFSALVQYYFLSSTTFEALFVDLNVCRLTSFCDDLMENILIVLRIVFALTFNTIYK